MAAVFEKMPATVGSTASRIRDKSPYILPLDASLRWASFSPEQQASIAEMATSLGYDREELESA